MATENTMKGFQEMADSLEQQADALKAEHIELSPDDHRRYIHIMEKSHILGASTRYLAACTMRELHDGLREAVETLHRAPVAHIPIEARPVILYSLYLMWRQVMAEQGPGLGYDDDR